MASGTLPKPYYTEYYDAGVLSEATSWQNAATTVFNNLNITDKTVCGYFGYNGRWMFMAFKYSSVNYGMMILFGVDGAAYEFRRNDGVDTYYSFTKTPA